MVDAKKLYVLYKDSETTDALSAYIIIYNLDGTFYTAYNFENGIEIPFPTQNTASSRTEVDCSDTDVSSMDNEEFEQYLANCYSPLPQVTVVAIAGTDGSAGGGPTGYNPFDNSNNWVGVEFPIGDPNGYNTGTTNGSNPQVFTPNSVSASAMSISIAIDALNSQIHNWLQYMENQQNYVLLQLIANYLNTHKERPSELVLDDGFGDDQFPNIQQEAIDFTIDLIDYLGDNPELDLGGMNQQQFDSLEDCYENINNFVGCFDEFIVAQLNEELEENPFLLLDIDCNQIQNWQILAQHTAPQSVQDKIDNLPSSFFNDFEIQSLEDANGTVVNLDYFPVNVTTLPKNPSTGIQFSAQEFLEYFRLNINFFVQNSGTTFSPYCQNINPSICQQETNLWNSSNPLGAIIYLDIPGDDGVVVCSEYTSSYWYFMTMNAPYAGNHPVSGTRQFGYEQNSDGSYDFFVRGVDRIDSIIVETMIEEFSNADPLMGADLLWYTFQENLKNFVNENNGSSSIPQATINRPNWNDVQDVLQGNKSISDLGCD